ADVAAGDHCDFGRVVGSKYVAVAIVSAVSELGEPVLHASCPEPDVPADRSGPLASQDGDGAVSDAFRHESAVADLRVGVAIARGGGRARIVATLDEDVSGVGLHKDVPDEPGGRRQSGRA